MLFTMDSDHMTPGNDLNKKSGPNTSDMKKTANGSVVCSDTSSVNINRSSISAIVMPPISTHRATPPPPLNCNTARKSQKRPLPTVLVSSSSSSSSSFSSSSNQEKVEHRERATEIVTTGEEGFHKSSLKRNRMRIIECPAGSVTKSDTIKETVPVTFNLDDGDNDEYTQSEMAQLADVLGMDQTYHSCDNTKEDSDDYKPTCFDGVTDPLDLELMSSSKYVVFENIGAGLDDCVVSPRKRKSPLKIKSSRCTANPMEKKEQGRCSDTSNQVTAVNKTYKIASHITATLKNLEEKKRGNRSYGYSAEIPLFPVDWREGNKSNEICMEDTIIDVKPTFPVDVTVNNIIADNIVIDLPLRPAARRK